MITDPTQSLPVLRSLLDYLESKVRRLDNTVTDHDEYLKKLGADADAARGEYNQLKQLVFHLEGEPVDKARDVLGREYQEWVDQKRLT